MGVAGVSLLLDSSACGSFGCVGGGRESILGVPGVLVGVGVADLI